METLQRDRVRKNKVERATSSRVLEGRTTAFTGPGRTWSNFLGRLIFFFLLMLIRQSDAFEKYFSFSINIFPLFEINMFYKATANTISES